MQLKKPIVIALVILASLTTAGCWNTVSRDETARLIAHPEFTAAAKAAPNFTKDALRTITQLEYELAQKK